MSFSVIKAVKYRRLRLAGHVARMKEAKNMYIILMEKCLGKRQIWRPRRSWRMILGRILERQVVRMEGGRKWFRIMSNSGLRFWRFCCHWVIL